MAAALKFQIEYIFLIWIKTEYLTVTSQRQSGRPVLDPSRSFCVSVGFAIMNQIVWKILNDSKKKKYTII